MTGPNAEPHRSGGRLRHRLTQWARTHPDAFSWSTAVAAAAALYAVAAPLEVALYDVPVLAGLAALAIQCAALVVALRFRVVAIAAFTAAAMVLSMRTQPTAVPWPWTMTGIICFALLVGSVWAVSGWRFGVAAYVVPVGALSVRMAVEPDAAEAASMVVALGVGVAAALVGALLQGRLRISRQLSREREHAAAEFERRTVIEERQRIARELHDVVSHGLSLIQVQAKFARYRFPNMPEDVATEVEDIARTAQASLGEMRQMLGALRGEGPIDIAPQPTLDGLHELVAETARAGARIHLRFDAPAETPTVVGITGYRIAQEAISNAVRHAPGSPIDVSVSARDGVLLVAIENGGGFRETTDHDLEGGGHGLIGMRERTSMLDGTLSTGTTASGGYRVAAALPLGHDSAWMDQPPPTRASGKVAAAE